MTDNRGVSVELSIVMGEVRASLGLPPEAPLVECFRQLASDAREAAERHRGDPWEPKYLALADSLDGCLEAGVFDDG